MDHKLSRHMWIMVLCCLIPVVALGAIFLLRVPVSGAVSVGLILLCPLSHLLLMRMMGQHAHEETHAHDSARPSSRAAEDGQPGNP